VGIHELEYSIVERFSVLKAMFIEFEAVDVITVLDALVAVVDICMAGKKNRAM
jgi:hypothetical protein